jgi:hypothetical protein
MPRIKITPAEIEKYLALLAATPERIAALTAGLDEARLRWSPSKKDWSVVEILAHLRACETVWTFSIYAMLSENNPALPLLDERRWAKAARYADASFADSFQQFSLKRAELLNALRHLPEEAWSRSATIEGRTHTVFSQSRRMALHEQEHAAQLEAAAQAARDAAD